MRLLVAGAGIAAGLVLTLHAFVAACVWVAAR